MTKRSHSTASNAHSMSGPNRTIWEVMLLRPKHRVSAIVPAKKIKFREHDGESRLFGQHRWDKAYHDASTAVLPDPPRTHHVNAMSLFKDLHEILKTLDDPSGYRFQMDSYLDWSDIHELQDWNVRERAARRQTRAEAAHLRKMPICHIPKDTRIFNRRLHKILLHASTPVVFHGNTHDIPIIAYTCVLELMRRGAYEPRLFRELPDMGRFMELIDIFNDGPSFGEGYNLRQENIHNIAAIFVDFVVKIKDPLIAPILFDPLWYWCVKPSVKRDNVARYIQESAEEEARDKILKDEKMRDVVPREDFYYVRKPVIWTQEEEIENEKAEGKQIDAAVILLKLLPSANLSLLVYFIDFFLRIISCRRNLVEQQDIVRIFAHSVIGGKSKPDSWRIMHWFLDRWPRLLNGLFPKNNGLTKRPAVSTPSVIPNDFHHAKSGAPEEKRASLQKMPTGISEDETVIRPSGGVFGDTQAISMSRVSSNSVYSNDEGGEQSPCDPVSQDDASKNQLYRRSRQAQKDIASESQNDAIMAMLTIMREEQARARRLERRLYARELEYKVQNSNSKALPSAEPDDDSIVCQKKMEWKNKQDAKEKCADSEKDSIEDIESMRQKFIAFLKARSDAQTESG